MRKMSNNFIGLMSFSVVTSEKAVSSTATGTICGLEASDFQTLGT